MTARGWTPARIRAARYRANLSQAELAQRIGASRRSVANWEIGGSAPQGRYAAQLDRVLNDTTATDPAGAGVLLADATFEQALARLVDLAGQTGITLPTPWLAAAAGVDRGPIIGDG